MRQNYFHFKGEYILQTHRWTSNVCFNSSNISRSIYSKQMYTIIIKHQIIGYFRYVDDILLVYDEKKTQTQRKP
jgi:hypothetical protein